METFDIQIKKFINWLHTSVNYSLYRCPQCNYSQGHQIIYCPKCGDSMVHKLKEPYTISFLETPDNLFYKMEFQRISDCYINYDDWGILVKKIITIINSNK